MAWHIFGVLGLRVVPWLLRTGISFCIFCLLHIMAKWSLRRVRSTHTTSARMTSLLLCASSCRSAERERQRESRESANAVLQSASKDATKCKCKTSFTGGSSYPRARCRRLSSAPCPHPPAVLSISHSVLLRWCGLGRRELDPKPLWSAGV